MPRSADDLGGTPMGVEGAKPPAFFERSKPKAVGITALISLYELIADPAMIGKNLAALSGVVPAGRMQNITDKIRSLTSTPHKALGLGAVVGLVFSIWSANAGVKLLFDALNAVYEERQTRSFLHRTWLSLAFTLGALAFVVIAMAAVVVVLTAPNYIGFGSSGDLLLLVGKWPILLAAIGWPLAFTYRYGPARARARWRWVGWGTGFAAIGWVVASAAFSWYVVNFGMHRGA